MMLKRLLFGIVTLLTLILAYSLYSSVITTGRVNSQIYFQLKNNVNSTTEDNYTPIFKIMDGSPPKEINDNDANNNTVDDTSEKILRLVNGITSNHPAPAENLWIELESKTTLIRRTVFFDNRASIGPAIVIILLHKKNTHKPKLYAKITMPNGIKWCQETKTVYIIKTFPRRDFRHGPDDFATIVKSLELKYTQIPNYIELSTKESCTDLLPAMPIYYEKYEKRVKFALCLHKGLFGDVSPEMLIHFVEINKILGASIITLWIQNTSANIYTAMLPYIKSGLVEVLDWKVSVPMRNYGQFAVNNECLYRNIHRADYLVLHDIDELIIPYKHDTWNEMLAYYSKKISLSHYSSLLVSSLPWKLVSNSNYSSVSNKSLDIPWKMACSKMNKPYYFEATDRFYEPSEHREKLIASLNTTIVIYTHHIKEAVEGIEYHYEVSKDIALVHHYRIPPLDGTYIKSTFMKKFVDKVMPGIKKQIC